MLRRLLKGDIEYELVRANESRGLGKYTTLWGIKRLLKRTVGQIWPGFREIEELGYFKYHKVRPLHWCRLFLNQYIHNRTYIAMQSGFGDMLEAYPYFRVAKLRRPNHRIIAVLHSPDKCRYPEMSHCKGSFLTLPDGRRHDYVREFLETNPSIDEIIYDDCWGDGYIYAYPKILAREFGFSFKKSAFDSDRPHLFSQMDLDVANAFLIRNGLRGKPFLAMHFKTGTEQLELILSELFADREVAESISVLAFGSVPPDLVRRGSTAGVSVVDLSRSYEKNVSTRQLICVASHASIFVGGRGGFNAVYYLLGLPTINIFDFQGRQEIASGLWPSSLWQDNPVGRMFWENDDMKVVYRDYVKRFLSKSDA